MAKARVTSSLQELSPTQLIAPFQFAVDDVLAVAVSGGPDSMALLHIAVMEARESGRKVHALTVDHGLRPEARAEAEQVAKWALALGVPHTILTHDGVVPTADIQASARDIRYGLMGQWCRDHAAAALLVAHTQDDQAETFLLRLGRGSGVDGLSGMAADSAREDGTRIVRPLLDVPREQLLALLTASGQDFISDPSNLDERHARVRVRKLMPHLEAEGMTARRLAETSARMLTARQALEGWTRSHVAASVVFDPGGFARVSLPNFMDVPEEILLRAMSRLVMAISGAAYPPRLHHTRALAKRLGDAAFSGATLGGVRVHVKGQEAFLFRESRAVQGPLVLTPEITRQTMWDGRFELAVRAPAADVPTELTLAPLGSEHWREVRKQAEVPMLPAAVGAGLPAVFAGGRVVDVPCLRGLWAAGGHGKVHVAANDKTNDEGRVVDTLFVGPMRAGLTSGPIATAR